MSYSASPSLSYFPQYNSPLLDRMVGEGSLRKGHLSIFLKKGEGGSPKEESIPGKGSEQSQAEERQHGMQSEKAFEMGEGPWLFLWVR